MLKSYFILLYFRYMSLHKILFFYVLLLLSVASYASNNLNESSIATPHQKNFYLGAGIGAGVNYFSPSSATNVISASNVEHAAMAYRFFGGYNLDKNFALELGYTNFGYYQNSASGNSVCNTSGKCGLGSPNPLAGIFNTEINDTNNISAYAIDLSTIARYNVTDDLNVFGRAGVNYLSATLNSKTIVSPQIPIGSTAIGPTINQNTTASSSALLPLLGIGYEYNPNNFLGIRVEYDYYFSVNMINNLSTNVGSYSPSSFLLSTIYNF